VHCCHHQKDHLLKVSLRSIQMAENEYTDVRRYGWKRTAVALLVASCRRRRSRICTHPQTSSFPHHHEHQRPISLRRYQHQPPTSLHLCKTPRHPLAVAESEVG
jgi:hypothetical protein